ncbi:MAG: A/G-specific adenine glycosylase [Candidatus Omnitrophica bacterium]|nr:A/G-specific adenine glycosylase [Candidatus Omnitrophota bacterium]
MKQLLTNKNILPVTRRAPVFDRDLTPFLLKWYKKNLRDLPWRKTSDPYHIWISEIMLQQTTVTAVIPYYERWFKIFPDIKTLASAPLQKVLTVWQGLGYYQRARNLHQAAQAIVSKFNTIIPSSADILKTLPGLGPYTIGAVLSIAYQKPLPVVDANVRRVLLRLMAIQEKINTKRDKEFYALLEHLIPHSEPGNFNQALMELGALICTSKNPSCHACPVSLCCESYKKGTQELIPEIISKKIKPLRVVIGIIDYKNKLLIQQRPEKGLLAGLWEFPGGKIEAGETPLKAIIREIKEETGLTVIKATLFTKVIHYYTQYKISLTAFHCVCQSYTQPLKSNQKWVTKKSLKTYPMPSGSAKIILMLNSHTNV